MAAYASASDMIDRHDETLIGDLIRDDHETATASEIASSGKMSAILIDASGQVEAAMLCGNRYSPAELTALEGNSEGMLKKIVCVIAMAELFDRRPGVNTAAAKHYYEQSKAYLEDLRTGKNLFNLTDDTDPQTAAVPSTEGPTVVEYTDLNLIPEQMVRHFPNRQTRLPAGR